MYRFYNLLQLIATIYKTNNKIIIICVHELKVLLIRQYLKSLSLTHKCEENNLENASYDIDLDVEHKSQNDNKYESSINLSLSIIHENKNVFMLSICYTGVFQIQNANADELNDLLKKECPRILFPFLREIVSKISRESGIKEILLNPVSFSEKF